jgi:hypothetical protein
MKAKLKSIAKYFGQAYADLIIEMLRNSGSDAEREYWIIQGTKLDFYFTEKLDIYLD